MNMTELKKDLARLETINKELATIPETASKKAADLYTPAFKVRVSDSVRSALADILKIQ